MEPCAATNQGSGVITEPLWTPSDLHRRWTAEIRNVWNSRPGHVVQTCQTLTVGSGRTYRERHRRRGIQLLSIYVLISLRLKASGPSICSLNRVSGPD